VGEDKYKKYKGYKFDPITYKVTGDAVRAYAKATGDLKPEYTNPDDSKIIAPPSFVSVIFLPAFYGAGKLAQEGLIKDFSKLLHGGQKYEYYTPIKPGDTIVSQVEIIDIYVKNDMLFMVFDIPIKKQDGTLAAKVLATAIIRSGGF
jgi:acyl dehydratase